MTAEEKYPTLARWAQYGVMEGLDAPLSTTREAAAALAELNALWALLLELEEERW